MASPSKIYELPGWWKQPDATVARNLEAELQRELPPGHLLYGIPVETFGYSDGSDDVLFHRLDTPDRFTIVHLTWLGHTEINAQHPTVEFDGTFAEFLAYHEDLISFLRSVAKKSGD
ncbi:MAG TPA: hypothetical protein VGI88_03975 [Verrucomicrobiae bacterium]